MTMAQLDLINYLGSGIYWILSMCSQILKEFEYLQALIQLNQSC